MFESAFADFVGANYGVAVSNGTAALHLTMVACGIRPDDEVIVSSLTFAASANCARYVGAKVVFADVRPDSLTIDVSHVESLITPRTRAIVAVDYGGLPCDLDELLAIARRNKLLLVEDACHAPGAEYRGRKVGSIADVSTFSFHPVKHITTGEGGMVTTNDPEIAKKVRLLRSHGIATDHRQRELQGTWRYDMVELGYNYRLPDVQCALGISQLGKLPQWLARRRQLANHYSKALGGLETLQLPVVPEDRTHAWHLFAVRIKGGQPGVRRREVFMKLREAGIGVNVHYLPVYLNSYYRSLGYGQGICPNAETAYDELISLPMWHGLSDSDQDRVIDSTLSILQSNP